MRSFLGPLFGFLVTAVSMSAVDGSEVFKHNCVACHGADGRGQTPMGRKVKAHNLGESHMTDAEIAHQVREGARSKSGTVLMPAFGDKLSGAEIDAVVLVAKAFRPQPAAKSARPMPPVRAPDGPEAPKFVPANPVPPADADGDWVIGPEYTPAPELTAVDGVPQGRVEQFVMDSADSKFYPGIARDVFGTPDPDEPRKLIVDTHPQPYKRTVTVYVPAQYTPGTPAPLLVVHDGPKEVGKPDMMIPHILDNMIAQGRVPAMVVVMIANGGGDAQGSERGLEYDTLSGKFAEFIQAEVLPAVETHCNVKITDDPEGRCVMGVSSGAAAAFTMAWFHNEWYHRVISYTGTFVNQQWPFNPGNPGGAWDYHEGIIQNAGVKPIRIWMQVGDRDLYNPNVMRDGMHDWVIANHRMAAVLKAKGYHYQYLFSLDCLHAERKVREQTLPEALEWVWRDYPIESGMTGGNSQP